MRNDIYYNPTKIYFGKDAELNVGKAVAELGVKTVMIQYGSDRIIKNGLMKKVADSIRQQGICVVELGGVEPNPKASLVYKAIQMCWQENVELLIAIGGGSVIDSCKATAVGVPYDGDFWDFYIGKAIPERALPVATVLTIPAAGSESSNSSVITNSELGYKRFLDQDMIRPVFSVLNPEYTYSLPKFQTACGVVDAFAHVVERYFTLESDVLCTDYLCEGVMKTLLYYGRKVMEEPGNYNIRAEIMWACKIAHDNSLGIGRLGDWASHMIEHELSAENDITHAAGLAVIMPAWMKYVSKKEPAKFVRMAREVFGIPESTDKEEMVNQGIRKYEAFLDDLEMPRTLQEVKIYPQSYETIASKCVEFADSVGNYVKIYKEDVLQILHIAESVE